MHRLQRFILSSGQLKPRYCTQVPVRHFTESFRAMAAKEYKLKGVTSLALSLGDKQEVEVEGVENGKVVLLNAAGKVQAVGAKCTHYGAPMAKGVLTKSGYLRCPWHGACFNAKTGDVEDAPALDALPVFDVAERDGAVYITGEESAIKSSAGAPTSNAVPPREVHRKIPSSLLEEAPAPWVQSKA
uniref:Rieske domain-containing protein n=1 Tax=Bionectria ochroleuca TaxID=29856 RepID=A0A8H7NCQ4_BIOOC